jgi:hypothetical protein
MGFLDGQNEQICWLVGWLQTSLILSAAKKIPFAKYAASSR